MNNYSDALHYVKQDSRYSNLSSHDLKMMRANMIKMGKFNKYEFALVQYWIMKKENRLYGFIPQF